MQTSSSDSRRVSQANTRVLAACGLTASFHRGLHFQHRVRGHLVRPNEAKRIEACFSLGGQSVFFCTLYADPCPQPIAVRSYMRARNPAVSMFFHKGLQVLEAFFPLSGEWIPHEAKRIEACLPFEGHAVFFYALNTNPLPQLISVRSYMRLRNPAVPMRVPSITASVIGARSYFIRILGLEQAI